MRGNRSRKVSADELDAFDSPNCPPLGRLEVHVTVYWDLIQRASTTKQFKVHTMLSSNVTVLRVFPNISAAVVRAMLQDPIEGVVMQCYGAGNFPDDNVELLEVLKRACDRGLIIVNTTQCRRGAVSISYAGAKSLLDIGIVPGYDMTSEAALAKLSYVLTKPWSLEKKKEFISKNIVGELMNPHDLPQQRQLADGLTIMGLEKDMVGGAVESMAELRETMIFPLLCMSIKRGDLEAIDKICSKFPGNMLMKDYDGRTPLHVAIRDGSYQIIQHLIKQGASVHAKDSFDRSPLLEAVEARRFDVIEVLLKSGAHLSMHPEQLAIKLNEAASRGDTELITAYWNAGAKLNVWDYSGRTPLHMAVLNSHMELIDYLLKHGSNPNLMDDQDHTPLFMTMNTKIIQMLDMGLELEKWNKIKRRPSNMSVPSARSSLANIVMNLVHHSAAVSDTVSEESFTASSSSGSCSPVSSISATVEEEEKVMVNNDHAAVDVENNNDEDVCQVKTSFAHLYISTTSDKYTASG